MGKIYPLKIIKDFFVYSLKALIYIEILAKHYYRYLANFEDDLSTIIYNYFFLAFGLYQH
ncbi:hypothetical protein TAO_1640 [Candidatus Nitrosoglobus terrae]|uniref:Uncharacterized protein n=1 Tax=Candidatus Nitrosoglobus terrae TaxID=1630141 RepID=A0A1Q2SPE5_9GAMM|nr:hypothetical protein TAO_1640 [Candidatus Nitrosoglobus terrae]